MSIKEKAARSANKEISREPPGYYNIGKFLLNVGGDRLL
jgi:hypothetical protein